MSFGGRSTFAQSPKAKSVDAALVAIFVEASALPVFDAVHSAMEVQFASTRVLEEEEVVCIFGHVTILGLELLVAGEASTGVNQIVVFVPFISVTELPPPLVRA